MTVDGELVTAEEEQEGGRGRVLRSSPPTRSGSLDYLAGQRRRQYKQERDIDRSRPKYKHKVERKRGHRNVGVDWRER